MYIMYNKSNRNSMFTGILLLDAESDYAWCENFICIIFQLHIHSTAALEQQRQQQLTIMVIIMHLWKLLHLLIIFAWQFRRTAAACQFHFSPRLRLSPALTAGVLPVRDFPNCTCAKRHTHTHGDTVKQS